MLAPGSDRIPVELFQILTQYAICRLPAEILYGNYHVELLIKHIIDSHLFRVSYQKAIFFRLYFHDSSCSLQLYNVCAFEGKAPSSNLYRLPLTRKDFQQLGWLGNLLSPAPQVQVFFIVAFIFSLLLLFFSSSS